MLPTTASWRWLLARSHYPTLFVHCLLLLLLLGHSRLHHCLSLDISGSHSLSFNPALTPINITTTKMQRGHPGWEAGIINEYEKKEETHNDDEVMLNVLRCQLTY